MLDTVLIIALCLISWAIPAWVLSRAAKVVGAKRSNLAAGALIVLVLMVLSVGNFAFDQALKGSVAGAALASIELSGAVLCFALGFFAMHDLFGLSWKGTWAPFGAYFGVGIAEFMVSLLIIRPFVAEAFVLPSNSMAPVAPAGTRLVASKLLHPRRWDIICYHEIHDGSRVYCKRLVGMPGESIMFKGGNIYINGQLTSAPPDMAGQMTSAIRPSEPSRQGYQDGIPITLAADEYFVLGDNVANSADSRWYGPTKRQMLVGVVDVIYWPPNRAQILR